MRIALLFCLVLGALIAHNEVEGVFVSTIVELIKKMIECLKKKDLGDEVKEFLEWLGNATKHVTEEGIEM